MLVAISLVIVEVSASLTSIARIRGEGMRVSVDGSKIRESGVMSPLITNEEWQDSETRDDLAELECGW